MPVCWQSVVGIWRRISWSNVVVCVRRSAVGVVVLITYARGFLQASELGNEERMEDGPSKASARQNQVYSYRVPQTKFPILEKNAIHMFYINSLPPLHRYHTWYDTHTIERGPPFFQREAPPSILIISNLELAKNRHLGEFWWIKHEPGLFI